MEKQQRPGCDMVQHGTTIIQTCLKNDFSLLSFFGDELPWYLFVYLFTYDCYILFYTIISDYHYHIIIIL